MVSIITKLNKAKLLGRGGGSFPTARKWQMVKKAKGDRKYVICNASEGEPGVKKDLYLLEKYPERVIDGMKIAMEYLSADSAYIYLNPNYYNKLSVRLEKLIGQMQIEIFCKSHQAAYVGGEETSVLNHIEGERVEPRLRPPFPPTFGLWGRPTLINNVETFFDVSMINDGLYENKRFYTINGDCYWPGVYEYKESLTIKQVLKESKNFPKFDFFVQVGGDASGEVLDQDQLDAPADGSASITIFSKLKHKPLQLIRNWADFFTKESCGQCVPCREGTYRLSELLKNKSPNWELLAHILNSLSETSFCGLGCAAPIAITSYIENVLSKMDDNTILAPNINKKYICDCFK